MSAPKERSRAAGFFFLNDNAAQLIQSKLNGAIHVLYKIINSVLGSAAESEIAVVVFFLIRMKRRQYETL